MICWIYLNTWSVSLKAVTDLETIFGTKNTKFYRIQKPENRMLKPAGKSNQANSEGVTG